MTVRFLIIDDHPICRTAAELVVRAAYPEAQITTAGSLHEANTLESHADVILLDLHLPDSSGVATVKAIRTLHPAARIVVITASDNDNLGAQLELEGAFGPIAKSAPMSTLSRALHEATSDPIQDERRIFLLGSIDERVASLTNGERKVLEAMSSGHQNKQIAYALGLSEATVKQHVKAVLRKLGASNRTQAVLMALSGAPDQSNPN